MDLDQLIDLVALPTFTVTAAAAVLVFIVLFAGVPWWRTAVGRALMASATACAMVTVGGLSHRVAGWTGDRWWSDALGDLLVTLGFGGLTVAYTWRSFQLWRMSRGDSAHHVAPGLHEPD